MKTTLIALPLAILLTAASFVLASAPFRAHAQGNTPLVTAPAIHHTINGLPVTDFPMIMVTAPSNSAK